MPVERRGVIGKVKNLMRTSIMEAVTVGKRTTSRKGAS
jgi:hypothetical protein